MFINEALVDQVSASNVSASLELLFFGNFPLFFKLNNLLLFLILKEKHCDDHVLYRMNV